MPIKTLDTDIFQTGAGVDAVDVFTSNETLIVDAGVYVFSQSGGGIISTFANTVVINNGGNIYGAGFSDLSGFGSPGWGVFLSDDSSDSVGNATVYNGVGGQIFGLQIGVRVQAHGTNVVENHGSITGEDQTGVFIANGHGDVLDNDGYIYGGVAGVTVQDGATIDNFNQIVSQGVGIDLQNGPGVVAYIHNEPGAVIQGDILAEGNPDRVGGSFQLVNDGTIIGGVGEAGTGSVVITNRGTIEGEVDLGSANAIFNGAGGFATVIVADGGNATIVAGPGNVDMYVGSGNDLLTAGSGPDGFFFEAALAGQVEEIDNFKPGIDNIVLSEADFAGLGPLGTLAAGHFRIGMGRHSASNGPLIIYQPSDGFLYYDANPHLPGLGTHFATLTTHVLVHNHVLTIHPLISNTDILLEA